MTYSSLLAWAEIFTGYVRKDTWKTNIEARASLIKGGCVK
jgi:hypothetical protein